MIQHEEKEGQRLKKCAINSVGEFKIIHTEKQLWNDSP
jgi:hypothetical protein